jgi:hypothetical protein
VCSRPAHELACVFPRLDAVEIQTFVDQLPDGLVALRGRFFERPVTRLGQGDGQTTHASLTLVL